MANVRVITDEGKRGCGYRKKGGLYLMCDGVGTPCGKLPIPLTVCPCCGHGIKPSLGWTWVNARQLAEGVKCSHKDCSAACPLHTPPEKAGLLWIGESFYKTPSEWMAEADGMGVSRKVSSVPRGFEVGKDWVMVAHRKAISKKCETCDGSGNIADEVDGEQLLKKCDDCEGGYKYTAAIFHAFKPDRVEYVIKGTETEDELAELERRGLSLVKLVRTDGEDKETMVWHRRRHIGIGESEEDQTYYQTDEGYVIWSHNSEKFTVHFGDDILATDDRLSKAKAVAEEHKEKHSTASE